MLWENAQTGGALPELYRIILSQQGEKYYKRFPINIARRIDKSFLILERNPFGDADIKPLAGNIRRYRIRVGDLRIIYQVNKAKKFVLVSAILPRDQAYK